MSNPVFTLINLIKINKVSHLLFITSIEEERGQSRSIQRRGPLFQDICGEAIANAMT